MGMIVPLILYFILIMGIAIWGSRAAGKRSDTKGFMEEYFIRSAVGRQGFPIPIIYC